MRKAAFSRLVGRLLADKNPPLVWQPAIQPYPRLQDFDSAGAGLLGKEGVYAVWHLGVRPQWLRVGATANLGAAFSALAATAWIRGHHDNAGVFVAWAMPAQDQAAALVRFLIAKLQPAFQQDSFPGDRAIDLAGPAIVCPLPPGTQQ